MSRTDAEAHIQTNPTDTDQAAIYGKPNVVSMVGRISAVLTISTAYLVPAAVSTGALMLARGRPVATGHAYRRLRKLLERLGPTYVKFGQMASGRRDALPLALCDELSLLHDKVSPMTAGQANKAFKKAYGDDYSELFDLESLMPVASGSIACVYRARFPGGVDVALKLRRPRIISRMTADLAVLEGMARFSERFPKCKGMPIGDLVGYMCTAIRGQLDLELEAHNLNRLRDCLAGIDGVRVPAALLGRSRPSCLAMEFIDGLDVANITKHDQPTRAELALRVLEAANHLLFEHGFVHCDLHPGNLYVTPDAQVVILDAGYAAEAPDEVRKLMGEFFMRLSLGHGLRCGQIILESAAEITPELDTEGFVGAVAVLVNTKAGPSVPDFTMMSFGNDLFDLQRDYGLYAKSDFAFPLMSLSTMEATVHLIDPDVDFQRVGKKSTDRPDPQTR